MKNLPIYNPDSKVWTAEIAGVTLTKFPVTFPHPNHYYLVIGDMVLTPTEVGDLIEILEFFNPKD